MGSTAWSKTSAMSASGRTRSPSGRRVTSVGAGVAKAQETASGSRAPAVEVRPAGISTW